MIQQSCPRLELDGVLFQRGPRPILQGISWRVAPGEHWAVLGANGSGKTTLLQIVLGYLWPTEGRVRVLGEEFGQVDLRQLRRRIGWVSSSVQPMIRATQSALQIVLSGAFASTALFDEPQRGQVDRARLLLREMNCQSLEDRPYGVLSQGEQQRVLIARALMTQPQLLILDEACSGLDLPSREGVLAAVDTIARSSTEAGLILVTHHTEEIPPSFSHALVLKAGGVLAQGPKAEVLTGEILSDAFGLGVKVQQIDGRYWPRVRPGRG